MIIAHAQTADEVINKYVDAIGGKNKLTQIKSLYFESSVQVMGNESPSTLTIINGKGFKMQSEFNGQKIVQCYTDKGGWLINPMTGAADAQPMPEEVYKAGKGQIDVGGPLFNYAAKGNKVELQGKENGAYKIKLTSKDSIETTYYIDSATYYITKSIDKGTMMGQEVEVTRTNSNYQKTDYGYVYPGTVEISYGGQFTVTSTAKKAEVNKEIDPKIFDMPK
jgi:hypothetical protein